MEEQIETARKMWEDVAREHGWYKKPFFIQVWFKGDKLVDSVAFKGMKHDIIIEG